MLTRPRPSKSKTAPTSPRLLSVKRAWHLTPNMIRVVFAGPALDGFPEGREGGNCKLLIPEPGESREAFAARLTSGARITKRTYTVRSFDASTGELAIDFVAHGDEGPASAWAARATEDSFLGFAGPSTPKVTRFEADWYLVAADLSALPVAAATLEAMPRDAKGIAVFEVPSLEDAQDIAAPDGVSLHWLIHKDAHTPSDAQERFFRAMPWPEGRVQTCIAGESGVIQALRAYLHQERQVPRADTYVSGYWKIGLVEDEHQQLKRAQG
ncbi:MAG: siderophore-interacting protein [Pseudomonadota bacterium]